MFASNKIYQCWRKHVVAMILVVIALPVLADFENDFMVLFNNPPLRGYVQTEPEEEEQEKAGQDMDSKYSWRDRQVFVRNKKAYQTCYFPDDALGFARALVAEMRIQATPPQILYPAYFDLLERSLKENMSYGVTAVSWLTPSISSLLPGSDISQRRIYKYLISRNFCRRNFHPIGFPKELMEDMHVYLCFDCFFFCHYQHARVDFIRSVKNCKTDYANRDGLYARFDRKPSDGPCVFDNMRDESCFDVFWWYDGRKYLPQIFDLWYGSWKDMAGKEKPDPAAYYLLREDVLSYGPYAAPFVARAYIGGDRSLKGIVRALLGDESVKGDFSQWYAVHGNEYAFPEPKGLDFLESIQTNESRYVFNFTDMKAGAAVLKSIFGENPGRQPEYWYGPDWKKARDRATDVYVSRFTARVKGVAIPDFGKDFEKLDDFIVECTLKHGQETAKDIVMGLGADHAAYDTPKTCLRVAGEAANAGRFIYEKCPECSRPITNLFWIYMGREEFSKIMPQLVFPTCEFENVDDLNLDSRNGEWQGCRHYDGGSGLDFRLFFLYDFNSLLVERVWMNFWKFAESESDLKLRAALLACLEENVPVSQWKSIKKAFAHSQMDTEMQDGKCGSKSGIPIRNPFASLSNLVVKIQRKEAGLVLTNDFDTRTLRFPDGRDYEPFKSFIPEEIKARMDVHEKRLDKNCEDLDFVYQAYIKWRDKMAAEMKK